MGIMATLPVLAESDTQIVCERTETALQPVCRAVAEIAQPVCTAVDMRKAQAQAPAPRWAAAGKQAAEFVALVLRTAQAQRCSEQQAVALCNARSADYPALAKKGVAISYDKFRRWKSKLVDERTGQVDMGRWQKVVPGYGAGRPTEVSGEHPFIRLINGFYLKENGPELPEAHRMAVMAARVKGMDHPELRLSVKQVAYYYERTENRNAVALARLGAERYRNEWMGWIDRDWSGVPVGYVLVGDHHLFDCAVRTYDDKTGKCKAVRPWLSAWLCNRALAFVGWIIRDIAPDSMAVEDSLLNAIRRMGNHAPFFVYTDNGKDYLSRGFVEDVVVVDDYGREHRHSIVRRLGTQALTALPYNARAKVIERMFKEVASKFSKYWFGYLGNRPGNRPDKGTFAWENPELLPSLQEFTEAFAWWVENMYHARPFEGSVITGGRSPKEMLATFAPERIALTDAELALAFHKPYARPGHDARILVGRGGRVTIEGVTYQSKELWDHQERRLLALRSRTPGDDAIVVCEADGRPICRVESIDRTPAIARTDADRERVSEGQSAVRKQLVHARTQLETMLPEKGTPALIGPVFDRMAVSGQTRAQAERLVAAERERVTLAAKVDDGIIARTRNAGSRDPADHALLERILSAAPEPETQQHGSDNAATTGVDDQELLQNLAEESQW